MNRYLSPDELYSIMQEEKVYIKPGMDSYVEWHEGLNEYKRSMLGTYDFTRKHLDEWGAEFGVSGSEIIETLAGAEFLKYQESEDETAEFLKYAEGVGICS